MKRLIKIRKRKIALDDEAYAILDCMGYKRHKNYREHGNVIDAFTLIDKLILSETQDYNLSVSPKQDHIVFFDHGTTYTKVLV